MCDFLAGITIDGKTVFTSDHALKLDWLPPWVAIIGSGYIGLEFSDVYTALGSEVTFIEASVHYVGADWAARRRVSLDEPASGRARLAAFEQAMDNMMPGFDKEIARLAQRLLINPRPIDWHTGVLATKVTPGVPGVKPVTIELTDFKTKEKVHPRLRFHLSVV